ncbi:alpha-1,3/4-fucosidase [Robertkochia solimangrovi]|nr:alpha-1,3/4-fucosidase [Robertkochia solimangrovi]
MPTVNTYEVLDTDTHETIIAKAAHVVPTENQYAAIQNEFIAFVHFGPNTFTRMEWGNGMEDPAIFDLQDLDTDQWCMAMKEAGMKMVILTAKHHDGFVLWQSRYTKHGIMSSPYKEGKGDILKELSASCQKYGLKLGIYLSPADLYQIEAPDGLYGNLSEYTPRVIPRPVADRPFANKSTFTFKVDDYNEYFLNQLFELLTEYGPIHEVWFDGAHPKQKGGQKYNYLAWKELISTLAPEAVVFGKQDVRWCGNESGRTRDTEWNIVPYATDPDQMNSFPDITAEDVGSEEKLYKAKYLHFQQAETNTSIREGWFYRDEDKQKVRTADDVFDIYERSVGGNSTFLLNIPPNRDGKFSAEDVGVLKEVGERIKTTYYENLFSGADGPKAVLDNDPESFKLLNKDDNAIEITTENPITINRFVIQEAIRTHGERVSQHRLEAWIHEEWQVLTEATNIGYKRILRFPEVTSNKFRFTVLASRFHPAISHIAAHYYKTRPPQLSITRDLTGMVTIQPEPDDFGWKPHGENSSANINSGIVIHYTTDGSDPTADSPVFNTPFFMESGQVKAVAKTREQTGEITDESIGILKSKWKVTAEGPKNAEHSGVNAIDADPNTYWLPDETGSSQFLEIDLGEEKGITAFTYTPPTGFSEGMIEEGILKISHDGKTWKTFESFKFGNLINDPTPRTHYFKVQMTTRFIRIESTKIAGTGKLAAIAEVDFLE